MSDFEKGNKVIVNRYGHINDCFVGKIGTVAVVDGNGDVLVDFEEIIIDCDGYVRTHTGNGHIKTETGYWFKPDDYDWHIECLEIFQDNPQFEFE